MKTSRDLKDKTPLNKTTSKPQKPRETTSKGILKVCTGKQNEGCLYLVQLRKVVNNNRSYQTTAWGGQFYLGGIQSLH